ncbi:hypothetical protein [Nocardia amikacinitolerans]|uniref:hypothetical protein n=1 Tax=Nocardia amikacinitolerans TaxID=756689 RepID=UPI0020A417FD|nr:hypothetical protein [Nocardia amikacinitolerans]MCP2276934.1 hypothetical protein [Nocardia amikacinitolerans]
MSDEKRLWEIRLGVIASEEQARAVAEQVERLLCPDPDHAPPCRIPWSISVDAEEDTSEDRRREYEDVVEQHRIESGTV